MMGMKQQKRVWDMFPIALKRLIQVIMTSLGTVAFIMVLLFPCSFLPAELFIVQATALYFSRDILDKLKGFCNIKTNLQKLE